MITKNVRLYLGDGFPVRIPVSQFDTMWQFVFEIIHNSQPWQIPTGATAVLNGRKPDGNVFAFSGTIANNTVTVDADVQMTAVAGQTVCELSILADGKTVGTANFILDVEDAPKSADDVVSDTVLDGYGMMVTNAVDDYIERHPEVFGGDKFTTSAKNALLALLEKVAYIDENGQTYIDALESELFPPASLLSITAVFSQGSATIYDTDTLDVLNQYLTVTANMSDGTTQTVSNYTLSGTLTQGTSTITVTYGGNTTTFTVTVSSIQSVTFELGGIGTNGLDETNSARARSEYIPIEGTFTYNVANGSVDSTTIDDDTISAQIGGIDNSTGGVVEQPNRIITQFIRTRADRLISVSNDKGYYIKAFAFSAKMARLSANDVGGLTSDSISGTSASRVQYIRLVFKKPDNSDFAAEELSSIKLTLNHFKASSDMSINASQSGYSFRVYDSSHNFLMSTGDQAINYIDSSAHIENWFNADESDYYVVGLPANSKYVRTVARNVAGSDVSSVSGKIEIDNELYAITWEE